MPWGELDARSPTPAAPHAATGALGADPGDLSDTAQLAAELARVSELLAELIELLRTAVAAGQQLAPVVDQLASGGIGGVLGALMRR